MTLSEVPLPASSFNDAIGVNLHMTYVGSPYDTDFAKWSPVLFASGIKHVRDAVCPRVRRMSWCKSVESARLVQLAVHDIRVDYLTALDQSIPYIRAYASATGVRSTVEAYEGPNECDVYKQCGDWQITEAPWQRRLYSLKSPSITVIGPSMVTQKAYATLGDLSKYMDVGNIHDYVDANEPETGPVARLAWVAATSDGKPVWCTEFNYSTDPTYANNGVPPVVQERYLPRLLLEHLRLGIRRTYIYQLFDYGPDAGAYMGLLHVDYTPKPAWTRLLQFMRFFRDAGTPPRKSLHYAIRGDLLGALHHVLFQRSDGTFLLALWLARPVYNPQTHAVLSPDAEAITVALPAGITNAALEEFDDDGRTRTLPLRAVGPAFEVPVRSLVSVMSFRL